MREPFQRLNHSVPEYGLTSACKCCWQLLPLPLQEKSGMEACMSGKLLILCEWSLSSAGREVKEKQTSSVDFGCSYERRLHDEYTHIQ